MKFLKKTPFFRLLIPWIAGLILFEYVPLPCLVVGGFLLFSVILLIVRFRQWFTESSVYYSRRWEYGVFVNVVIASLAWFSNYFSSFTEVKYSETPQIYIATLLEEPQLSSNRLTVVVQLIDGEMTSKALLVVIKDSLTRWKNMNTGDLVLFKALLKVPEKPRNPASFDESEYLRRKGIHLKAIINLSQLKIIQKGSFSLTRVAGKIRDYLIELFTRAGVEEQRLAVLVALTLGQKGMLDFDTRNNFGGAGAMHVLAVSGLHVGIIYFVFDMLIGLFFKKKKKNWRKSVFVIVLLWFYAFVTGFSPSVNRATTMFSLVSLGAAFSQKSQTYNTISITAFALLYLNANVLYDIGFQLSFAAVIGIVYFQPIIKPFYKTENFVMKWIWELIVVSISAQIGTLPLSLYYFGQFPVYFLLANLIVIPLTTLLLYLSFTLVAFFFMPPMYQFLGLVLDKIVEIMLESVELINSFPNAVVHYKILWIQVVFLYLFIVFLSLWNARRTYLTMINMIFVCCLYLGVDIYRLVQQNTQSAIIVFSDYKDSTIEFVQKGFAQVFVSNSVPRDVKSYHEIMLISRVEIDTTNTSQYLNFCKQRIFIVRKSTDKQFFKFSDSICDKMSKKIDLDLLVFTKDAEFKSLDLLPFFGPRQCVIECSVGFALANEIEKRCKLLQIKCYNCRKEGAYIQKFFSNFVLI